MDFAEKSYARHAAHLAASLVDDKQIAIAQTWFDETTADYWRHARCYDCASCVAGEPGAGEPGASTNASWLTVGDGRFGLDAVRIGKRGFADVLASDISEHLLKAARERGLIARYAVENAERLSFADRAFDYVFCKEALHHFPRPYIALYEMLRVARKAVFLIEPNDMRIGRPPAVTLTRHLLTTLVRDVPRGLLARLSRRPALVRVEETTARADAAASYAWEESGNYVYEFSRREAEKVALGLDLPQLAFKGLNDHYVEGCELEPADLARSAMFREMRARIDALDQQCAAGLREPMLLMAGFFLAPMSAAARERFTASGWSVTDLPRNPHARGL